MRGIARMVEEGQNCIDILTQVSAACRALQTVALALLDEHVNTCLVDAAHDADSQRRVRLKEPPTRSPGWSAANDAIAAAKPREGARGSEPTDMTTVLQVGGLDWATSVSQTANVTYDPGPETVVMDETDTLARVPPHSSGAAGFWWATSGG